MAKEKTYHIHHSESVSNADFKAEKLKAIKENLPQIEALLKEWDGGAIGLVLIKGKYTKAIAAGVSSGNDKIALAEGLAQVAKETITSVVLHANDDVDDDEDEEA